MNLLDRLLAVRPKRAGQRRHCLARVCRAIGLLLAILVHAPTNSSAQAAPAVIRRLDTLSIGTNFSAYRLNYGERSLQGAAVYVDANYTWRYGLEAEGRWLWLHQRDGVRDSTYLIGPRLQFNGPRDEQRKLRPYTKFLIGVAQFRYPYGYATGRYFVLAPGGGIDYRLSRRIRFRLVDVEYQLWPQFTYGTLSSFGISSGIRVRLF
jgi:hypothetical protein